MESNREIVECRSDSEYAGRPLAICWEGQRLDVNRVLAEWRSPTGKHFRVIMMDNSVIECRYSDAEDKWSIEWV